MAKTFAEHIASLEANRDAKIDERKALAQKALEESRTMDADEAKAFDEIELQITPDPAAFLNRDATRAHVRSQVIGTGSNTADCPDLTFCSLGDDVASGATKTYGNRFLYAFPNALTTSNNGFTDPFTPTATVLMTVVRIKDRNYYYPVALKGGLAANTEYKVDLTISGLGNKEDNPFAKIEKGDLTATVQVLAWTTGTPVSENI